MSYIDALSDISRDGDRSITQQIIDVLTAAIGSGELQPGDRLPPTRELAERVGVNHLTAVRAYRRMREQGQVTARQGAGTFVVDPRAVDAPADEPDWQRYVLPSVSPNAFSDAVSAASEQHADDDVVPLSVGYPPSRTLPVDLWARHTANALETIGPAALQYGPIEGVPVLREQLAHHLGDGDDPEDLIVVQGAMQGLSLAAQALIQPGDAVAVESPTFMGAIQVLRQAGARIFPIGIDDQGLDVDELAQLAVREDLRAVFLQSRVQNPTSRDLAPDRADRLLELARRHAFFVVDDEVWADLRFTGEDPGSLRRRAPAHVIALGSFSKTLGGGLRMGWMRASGGMVDRLALAKHSDDLHSPTLTQYAMATFLADGDYAGHLDRVLDEYLRGRDLMLDALDRHLRPVASWTEPAGGCCVLVTLDAQLDDRALQLEAERLGVSIMPGSAMTPDRPGTTMMRLAYGYVAPDAIDLGIRRLATAIRSLGRERRARSAFPLS
ncbi:MAG: PLP-dependent aminotransferase family protein [Solirubrobacteraceae bacterium]|nr:PLP-dependent aminotransferase family protein [Solirubrobacteraceae bacterium]